MADLPALAPERESVTQTRLRRDYRTIECETSVPRRLVFETLQSLTSRRGRPDPPAPCLRIFLPASAVSRVSRNASFWNRRHPLKTSLLRVGMGVGLIRQLLPPLK